MDQRINYEAYGIALIRIILGTIFVLHGSQKVLGLFGGPGLQGFLEWIGTFGITPLLGYLAAFAEFIGGWMLLLGVASEVGAILVIPVMIGAVFYVHWENGYFAQDNGFEYPFNLIWFLIAIIIAGPGKYYLWDPFKRWRS